MDGLIERIIGGSAAAATGLSAGKAAALVECLKAEADRHWLINANRSLELAELIIEVGRARGEPRHIALGLMARGDALKLLSRAEDAWDALGEAGALFRSIGDEVGWARTRIGRLLICVDLQRVGEALDDAAAARERLGAAGMADKCLVLDMNTAIVHHLLGDYARALELYRAALAAAEASPAIGAAWLGPIHSNIGYVYDLLGDFRRAAEHYARARQHLAERGEAGGVARVEVNSAHVEMAQGHYRRALSLLHRARAFYAAESLPLDATQVDGDRVECYMLLNRFAEARELAREVCAQYRAASSFYREAQTLAHLATAEAELGAYEAARAALDGAEAIFAGLRADAWVAAIRLRRGKIAHRQGDLDLAAREACGAAEGFEGSGRLVDQAEARLLHGQVLLARGDLAAAGRAGAHALRVARRCNVPQLRYSAHLHNGRVAAAGGRTLAAGRSYQAAVATVARAQQGLTITLRPGFLENKGEAMHALMGLHLDAGRVDRAFALLEQVKSQAMLGYIANRDELRWPVEGAEARPLIEELNQLRAEHHWIYRRACGQPAGPDEPRPEQARARLAEVERRMRAVSERLYLLVEAGDRRDLAAPPSPGDVQSRIAADEALVEFYSDGSRMWAFTISRGELRVEGLPISHNEVERGIGQIELNLQAALRVGPEAPLCDRLREIAVGLLRRLYDGLLAPVADRVGECRRLLIVPFGILHYVPFHLLHDGRGHLVERHEVAILPAGGLVTRPPLRRPPGALVLAHTAGGTLPSAAAEGRSVQRRFGGALYCDGAAGRAALSAAPVQLLHIAAHGQHRLDHPGLSYISLADGQLYADDLLQQDMSYELVTLSACETGRAALAAGDELIGLGRGLLYAGAGALITSLWRVPDGMTAALMERLYRGLHAGLAKSAALRGAQRELLADAQNLHPAFWGAFQLVGDARPLSAAGAP